MLEIVLFILKTAGIIVASILGILIVLAASVLFVPVRYGGEFSASDAEDGEKKTVCAKCRATWLLCLVRVYAVYEETFRVRVKLLFFTLLDTAKERKEKRERKGKRGKEKKREKTGSAARDFENAEEAADAGETQAEDLAGKSGGDGKAAKEASYSAKTSVGEKARAEENGTDSLKAAERAEQDGARRRPNKEKKTKKSQNFNILQTIRDFCGRMTTEIKKMKGKAERIKEKAEEIGAFWKSPHVERARGLVWKELRYLLRHTKPRKIAGHVRFGFDDPSLTGYAMAVYGILYPIWLPKLSVEPDFEKEKLDCRVEMRGKVRVWHLAWAALRLFLSKDVRRAVRDGRKLKT